MLERCFQWQMLLIKPIKTGFDDLDRVMLHLLGQVMKPRVLYDCDIVMGERGRVLNKSQPGSLRINQSLLWEISDRRRCGCVSSPCSCVSLHQRRWSSVNRFQETKFLSLSFFSSPELLSFILWIAFKSHHIHVTFWDFFSRLSSSHFLQLYSRKNFLS